VQLFIHCVTRIGPLPEIDGLTPSFLITPNARSRTTGLDFISGRLETVTPLPALAADAPTVLASCPNWARRTAAKVALIAVMRELITLPNHLLKNFHFLLATQNRCSLVCVRRSRRNLWFTFDLLAVSLAIPAFSSVEAQR